MSSWPPKRMTLPNLAGSAPITDLDWSSGACARGLKPGAPSRAEVPEPGSVALVGPRFAGKTSFLRALQRAFDSGNHRAWTRFVPGRRLSDLLTRFGSEPPEPGQNATGGRTETPTTYTLQIGMRPETGASGKSSRERDPEELELSILDTPGRFFEVLSGGGATDGEPATGGPGRYANMVRAIQNARCLVLCFPTSEPQVRWSLTGFVNQLLALGRQLVPRVGATPFPGRETPWERSPRLELPFERVLVLLTGIEGLCSAVTRQLQATQGDWLSASLAEIRRFEALQGLGPWGIAQHLDLWSLAKDKIHSLEMLRSSMQPGAQLALCGVSTVGLERLPSRRDDWNLEESMPLDQVGECRPFGIWQSLLFMSTGEALAPLVIADSDLAQDELQPSRSSR